MVSFVPLHKNFASLSAFFPAKSSASFNIKTPPENSYLEKEGLLVIRSSGL
jgi:hypothetical protein